MPTWDKATGTSGTMRIYDTGSVVHLQLNSGQPTSCHADATFTYSYPGSGGNITGGGTGKFYPCPGNVWRTLASFTVTSSGTVWFSIPKTISSGIGGPTTHSAYISRATVPAAPKVPTLSEITMTSMKVTFGDNGNGGSAITQREFVYNTSNTRTGGTTVAYSGATTISNLIPGQTYYFWARVRNAVGWSSWTAVKSQATLAGGRIKVGGVWKNAIPFVKSGGVWKMAIPFVKTGGTWKQTR